MIVGIHAKHISYQWFGLGNVEHFQQQKYQNTKFDYSYVDQGQYKETNIAADNAIH